MEIPRNMQPRDGIALHKAFKRDDVVDMLVLRTVCVDFKQGFARDPWWGTALDVLSTKVKSSRIVRIVGPTLAALSVQNVFALFVAVMLLLRYALSVVGVGLIPLLAPLILILAVLAKVIRRASFKIYERTRLTAVADSFAFLVILRARLIDAARRANLGIERFLTRFHERHYSTRRCKTA